MPTLEVFVALAMLLPVSERGKDPTKIVKSQPLDLSGEWEGYWWTDGDKALEVDTSKDKLIGSRVKGIKTGSTWIEIPDIIDEGNGKLRGTWSRPNLKIHGIYKQKGDQLIVCFDKTTHHRPTSFLRSGEQCLLILHRVKPRK